MKMVMPWARWRLENVAPDVLARLRVEADRRLVEEEDARAMEKAAGYLQAALHAAGVRLDDGVAPVPKLDDAQHLFDAARPLVAGHVVDVAVEAQVLDRR